MVQEGELALTPTFQEDTLGTVSGELQVEGDTLPAPEPKFALVLTPPEKEPPAPIRSGDSFGVSFILSGLFILFLIIALRFRDNIKYVVTMFRSLLETRTRHNVFDDTVRETSLLVMLNLLWCAGAGITGYCVLETLDPSLWAGEASAIGMLWGMAIAAVYTLFMWGAYASVGWVFGDVTHARLWVKGFAISQSLMAPAFFLTALAALCSPTSAQGAAMTAAVVFILVKLAFIWKGYRIFFYQFSSWVLFLCYLCSLEIVPLILSYRGAVLLGMML